MTTSNCLFLRANIFFSSSREVLNYIYIYIPYDSVSPKAHCINTVTCLFSCILEYFTVMIIITLCYGLALCSCIILTIIEFFENFPRASHFFIVQYFDDVRKMLLCQCQLQCQLQVFQELCSSEVICHLCTYNTPLCHGMASFIITRLTTHISCGRWKGQSKAGFTQDEFCRQGSPTWLYLVLSYGALSHRMLANTACNPMWMYPYESTRYKLSGLPCLADHILCEPSLNSCSGCF